MMADASPTPPQAQTSFQFIDVTQNESAEERSRKRTIARSHVMKTVRRGQRKPTDVGVTGLAVRRRSSHSSPEASVARSPRIRSYCEENEENPQVVVRARPVDAFSQQFQNNIRSSYTSGSSRMEADLSSNSVLSNSWTPFAFEMMNHNLKVIWPLFWPGTSSEKSNPMAMGMGSS